eukprot:835071-Prorocentrum_minimum.AAC.1
MVPEWKRKIASSLSVGSAGTIGSNIERLPLGRAARSSPHRLGRYHRIEHRTATSRTRGPLEPPQARPVPLDHWIEHRTANSRTRGPLEPHRLKPMGITYGVTH